MGKMFSSSHGLEDTSEVTNVINGSTSPVMIAQPIATTIHRTTKIVGQWLVGGRELPLLLTVRLPI